MNILIGADREWANVRFVALIDGIRTIRASSLPELAQSLYALGVDEHAIRLAAPDDGDHAMSLSEHAAFHAAWMIAAASAKVPDDGHRQSGL
jgi:hypothetical protein